MDSKRYYDVGGEVLDLGCENSKFQGSIGIDLSPESNADIMTV